MSGTNSSYNTRFLNTTDATGLIIQGNSTQTANLQEWKNSSGTVLASISPSGNITKINNVTTSFPTDQGAVNSFLRNDGSGNLTWKTLVAGPTGATGAMGIAGIPGAAGVTGATGAAGTNGAKGATGATGPTGVAGSNGADGATGATGATGANGDQYATTSSTSMSVATGTKNFTVATGLAYTMGQIVTMSYSSTTSMTGSVTTYNSVNGTMSVSVTSKLGSGTYSSWSVNLNGIQGPTGADGANGTNGSVGATGTTGATGATGTAGAGYLASSSSSVSIGTGSKTFTTQSGLAFQNERVRISNTAAPTTKYMEGVVTSYSGTSITVSVDRVVGSGTLASWNIGIAGDVGAAGPAGADGVAGATGATGTNGDQYATTSTTSMSVATGNKTFTVGTGLAYTIGQIVSMTNSTSTFMTGPVSAYNAVTGSMTVGVTSKTGSGTYSSWSVNLTGIQGYTGPTGADGTFPSGSSAGNTPYWNGSSWVVNSSNIYNNGGNVGVGTTSPGSALDVKGALRLSGSSSGYVGFAPAAAAGSTTYTLPSTDGTANASLRTNGSGLLSWSLNGTTKFARKTADESVTSSTSLQDDNHLQFAIGANETWDVSFVLRFTASSGGDIKFALVLPSGATM
ncbi:MAG: collagen-like protein, partial [Bacteroidetes bacterium]|nr:collagen-like protein [Bacteroidota bacterium]